MPAHTLIADDDASVPSLLATLVRRARLEVDEVAAGLCRDCSLEFSPAPAHDDSDVRTSILLHLARCPLRPALKDDRDPQRLVDQISDSLKEFHPDVN